MASGEAPDEFDDFKCVKSGQVERAADGRTGRTEVGPLEEKSFRTASSSTQFASSGIDEPSYVVAESLRIERSFDLVTSMNS